MININRKFNIAVVTISMFLYCINRFSNLFSSIPCVGWIFKNHFNDFLGSIVFTAYVNLLLLCNSKFHSIQHLFPLLLFGSICSIFWEGLAPLFISYSVADWRDCVAYLLGSLTYWIIFKLVNKLHLSDQK